MARTAPVPNFAAIPGMNPGIFILGGGGDGGGSGAGGGKGGAGKQGAGGNNGGKDAQGDGKSAPDPNKYPHCGTASHPVDVATGRAFTHPILIADLAGPLPLRISRSYSASAAHLDFGLGWGWGHSLGLRVEERRRSLKVWTELGTCVTIVRKPDVGETLLADFGVVIRREPWGYLVDPNDGRFYLFAAKDDNETWLLTAIEDRNKNKISLTYHEGHLVEVTDSAGRLIRFRRDSSGRALAIECKNAVQGGRWLAFESYDYDDEGHLIRALDADGFSSRYEYDTEHRLTSDTDRTGLCFHFRYDSQGRCIESWGDYPGKLDPSLDPGIPKYLASARHPARGIHHCVFEYLGDATHVIDSTFVRTFEHNAFGLLTSAIDRGPEPMRAEYDEHGFLLSQENPDGGVEQFVHDSRGNLLRHTNPLGHTIVVDRDASGLPIAIEDPLGGITRFDRDAAGNIARITNPLRETTVYRYDARGLVTERIEPNGAISVFEYDPHGNLVRAVQPNGGEWRFRHDFFGRLTSKVDPLGAETRFTYSDRGDLVARVDALGGTTRYRYDGEKHLTSIENPMGHTTELLWGGYHKLCSRKDANGNVIHLRYNREGELTTVVNEHGEEYRFEHDIYGRVIGEHTFDGRILSYRLDAMGRPVRITRGDRDAKDGPPELERTELTYDLAGRLIERAFAESKQSFAYDPMGNLIEAHTATTSVTFERDPIGRIIREAQHVGGEAFTIEARHDALGNRTLRRTSLGHTEEIARNPMGARVSTKLDGGTAISHATDILGREIARRLPLGGTIETAFDPLGRVIERRAAQATAHLPWGRGEPEWVGSRPDEPAARFAYRYDMSGELVAKHDNINGATEYRYDPIGQVLAAVPEKARREVFAYDVAGNLFEGDGAPQRQYAKGNRLVRKGDTVYEWDAEGRLVEKREHVGSPEEGRWRYAWNEAGLLEQVEAPNGARLSFEYDGVARRVRKQVLAKDAATGRLRLEKDVRFVWDGDLLLHELTKRIAKDAAEADDPIVEVRTYCFDDEPWVPSAHKDPHGRWVYYLTDSVGTPERLIDETGAVSASLDRRTWSVTEQTGAEATTPLRFPGQYEDAETGLCYNRFRYYDPESGLFARADPLGLEGGTSPYRYAYSPLLEIDPLGLNASDLPIIRPGTPQWKAQVKEMKQPGGGRDCRVATQADAERLLQEGRGNLTQMPTYTNDPYKAGYEVHPNESHTQNAPQNDLPHIKWKDWTGGKKQGGSGHIFFG